MIEYHRDDASRRLLWIARETVTIDDVLSVTDRQALEGAWSYPLLYDARNRTGSLTHHELRELDGRVATYSAQFGRRGPMAIVVGWRAYGMRRMFTLIGRLLRTDSRVFSRVSQAEAWLTRGTSPGATAFEPDVTAGPCPRCRSRSTVLVHEQSGQRLFFCADCEYSWSRRSE